MRNLRIIILLSILAIMAQTAAVRADKFVLENDDYKEVDSYYTRGDLWSSSIADVVQGGYLDIAYLNQATLNILNYRYGTHGTSVNTAYAYNNSTVNIFGGKVNSLNSSSSTVNISDGEVDTLKVGWNCTASISGGEIIEFSARDNSKVTISGGTVDLLTADHLKMGSEDRVNITGGTVETLIASISVRDQSFSLSSDLTLSDLGEYGVQAAEGAVNSVSLGSLLAYNYSTVDISGSSVDVLSALDNSTASISGGVINEVIANNNSKVTISGGTVDLLTARHLRKGSEDRVNITGGEVDRLNAGIYVVGNETFSLSSDLTMSDLGQYGVQAAEGAVNSVSLGSLWAYDNSTVDISGSSVDVLSANHNSTVNISGGEVTSRFEARDSSTVNISGGEMDTLRVYNSSVVNISGGSFTKREHPGGSGINARDNSTINISGGSVDEVRAFCSAVNISGGSVYSLQASANIDISGGSIGNLVIGDNAVNISGGNVDWMVALGNSLTDISGGIIEDLYVRDGSLVNIHGWDFDISGALAILETGELTGTGTLTGKWFDGTSWSMDIARNNTTATIMLVPEPTTIALFALGSLALLKSRRQSRQV